VETGPNRREVLKTALVGATGLVSAPAFSIPSLAAPSHGAKRRKLILLWQDGGPTHFETFDPKPDAPIEFRGELRPIQTALPGIAFCEVLPTLASMADRLCIVRSLHQPSSGHVIGSHNVLTGWYDQTDGGKSRYPDVASVICRMRSGSEESDITIGASTDPRLAQGMRAAGSRGASETSALPSYIDINKGLHRGGPAYLGPLAGPFQVAGDPSKPGFVVQNLHSVGSLLRFQDRQVILRQLDHLGRRAGARTAAFEQLRAVEGFRRQAVELLSGGAAARAFDVSREAAAVRRRYGEHLPGQQCLLARRLVEAGVEVVAVRFTPDGRGDYDKTMIGWDDHAVHGNIFPIMKKRGPQFDQSVSALIEDLEQRGMRDEVLLVVVGEFGRTPRIHVHHGCPGREHWGPSGCALVYGGGLQMGQIVGSTNDKGERPLDRPVSYQDLLATIYHAMGVDTDHTFVNSVGRPTPILSSGKPIAELTASRPVRERTPHRAPLVTDSDRSSKNSRGGDDTSAKVAAGSTGEDLVRLPLSHLETLVARDTRIDDDGLRRLAACGRLRRLELNGAPISDRGMVHLANLTSLSELNLTGTRVTDAGLDQLARLKQLSRLFFNGTGITLGGVVRLFVNTQQRTLADALTAMGVARRDATGRVVSADLAATEFGDEQMQHLGQLTALQELQLTATSITDIGMEHVAPLSSLEQLYLCKCEISDAGLAHVAGLRRLRYLNIYGTKITTDGLQHLNQLTELRHLLITDLKLSRAAVDKLKQQLPLLKVTDFTPV
jgi:hypothetical protein